MTTPRAQTLQEESKATPESKKIEEIIASFNAFYTTPIIEVVERFLNKDAKAELDITTRLRYINPVEQKELTAWVQSKYGNESSHETLSARELLFLGDFHRLKLNKMKPTSISTQYFKQAAAKGDCLAHYSLYSLNDKRDLKQEISYLEEKLQPTYPHQANEALALHYESINPQKAFQLYQISAPVLGGAAYNLGLCYGTKWNGTGSVVQINYEKAYEWFEKAAALGSSCGLLKFAKKLEDTDIGLTVKIISAVDERCHRNDRRGIGIAFEYINKYEQAVWNYRIAYLNEDHELLNDLFSKHSSNSHVCYHAAIGLQNSNTPQEAKSRESFNTLLHTHPDDVSKIRKECADNLETLVPLFEINDASDTDIIFLSLDLFKTSHLLPSPLIKLISEYICNFLITELALTKENTVKRFWQKHKDTSEADMFTLFGKKDHLHWIEKAEKQEITFARAHKNIFGK